MRIILALLILLPLTGAHSQNKSPQSSAGILETERKIVDAVIKTDTLTVSSLLSTGYTYTLPDGKIISKKQYLNDIAIWWRPISIDHSDQKVSIYKKTAIVIGKATYKWKNKNGEIEEANEQYTDTYIKRGKKWIRISSHASCLSGRCT
jgi:Domain of unknown function (DUF4440)